MGKTHEQKMNKFLLVAVLAFAVFAAGSELQELSNNDVDTADLAPAEKATAVAETSDDVGEGQFGGTLGGALLTSGSFTMMAASGGFEEALASVGLPEREQQDPPTDRWGCGQQGGPIPDRLHSDRPRPRARPRGRGSFKTRRVAKK